MATRFTKDDRQRIVREFAVRHNGQFNATLFLQEVQETGETHEAWSWFQWDGDKAANEHRLWQAREFSQGLVVTFEIEEIGRNKAVKVTTVAMPMVLSQPVGRTPGGGGGYVLTNPDDPEHVVELCRQAAVALQSWHSRYSGALRKAGGSVVSIERAIAALERAAPSKAA